MFADVAVDFVGKDRLRTYTYAIPDGFTVQPGDILWIPFAYRPIQGITISVSETTETQNVRQIDSVVAGGPFISPQLLKTAAWIADHYRTSIFRACVAMLPPGTNQQLHIWVSRSELALQADQLLAGFSISPDQSAVLNEIPTKGRIRRDRLVRKIKRSNERHLDALVRAGVAIEESIWERPRVSAIFRDYLKISEDLDVNKAIENYRKRRAHRRIELLSRLASLPHPIPRTELSKMYGAYTIKAAIDDGIVQIQNVRVERDPLADYAVQDSVIPDLIPEQKAAVEVLSNSIQQTKKEKRSSKFLLFGVTGSGKTEVYLQAVQKCVETGLRAIIMVPEIAMTPQTLQRFASRFPGQIALQHSGLSIGQRFDQWHQIKAGQYSVVIGSRSSIFAPVDDLGLVVIDEEHEWTFKQSDRAPRYHARDVAEKLCDNTGATLLLGSATPDLATYRRATDLKDVTLLRLPRRVNDAIGVASRSRSLLTLDHQGKIKGGVSPHKSSVYPKTQIVDMRLEIYDGHREMLSRPLLQALRENVDRGEKSILFINRRGSASFVQCLVCGTIRICRNCQTPLTLHRSPRQQGSGSRLQCHYCSYSVSTTRQCPKCNGTGISRRAAGTEGVEEAVRGFFANTHILRWDSDTARNANEHAKILHEFQKPGNHILIGTQMVAKGLDIPTVSLVGVIAADIGLAVPSFRSSERTFQILSQVTGRAGRYDIPGKAIIQTFQPQHFTIVAAAKQDYQGFYQHEIDTRRRFKLPPFTSCARLVYGAFESNDAEMEARSLRTRIEQHLDSSPYTNIEIAGPSPAFPARLAGRYRWQILLKGQNPSRILDQVPLGPGWVVDIDPLEMN